MKKFTMRTLMNNFTFMNTVGITFFLALILSFQLIAQNVEPADVNLTGQQLWEKCISYHDPHGKWNTYEGIMHMVTVIGKNEVMEEVIEINKPENYYKCTWIDGEVKAVKGIKNSKSFFAINDDNNPSEELIKKYDLTEENVSFYKVHHTCHFGLPMELKISGMTVEDKVDVVEFDDRKCYKLSFIGISEKATHEYYEGRFILYVDMVTFAMRGIENEPTEYPKHYTILSREIEVNGIKIPHVKSTFRSEDDIHLWSSIFTTISP